MQALLAKAEQGDRSSQMWLGAAYEQGWFGQTDLRQALRWFKKAAAQGEPDAESALGQMYEHGEGLQQNYKRAAKWYKRAAEHVPNFGGAGQGRNNLGLLYASGLGVPKDDVKADMWFRLAGVDTNISKIEAQMTNAQIVRARRAEMAWRSRHPEP